MQSRNWEREVRVLGERVMEVRRGGRDDGVRKGAGRGEEGVGTGRE